MDHVTVADEEVLVPVKIEVEKPRTEAHVVQPDRRDSRADARMDKLAPVPVAVQSMGLVFVV